MFDLYIIHSNLVRQLGRHLEKNFPILDYLPYPIAVKTAGILF
jgi:hypothetical protein